MNLRGHFTEPEDNTVGGLTEILVTFNRADVAIVESVLGDNEIGCTVVGGNSHYDAMRVLVRAEQYERALGLMRGLKLSFSRIASTK
jgi:hypothetical protein